MKRFRWLGIITAALLAFSLFAPIVGGVGAADDEEETPIPTVVEVVDEGEDSAIPPVEETAEPPEEETTPPPDEEVQVPEEAAGETPEPALEDQTPVVEETPVADELVSQDEVVVGEEEVVVQDENGVDISTAGTIKVYVADQFGDPVPGAAFAIIAKEGGSCSSAQAGSEQTTDQNGIAVFTGIDPETTFCVFVTTVPSGYSGPPAGTSFEITPAAESSSDPYDLDGVLYLVYGRLDGGSPNPGRLTLLKYYCVTPNFEVQRITWDWFEGYRAQVAAETSSLPCEPGAADFWIEPVNGGSGFPISTSSDGSANIDTLEPGRYLIHETAPYLSWTLEFEIFSDTTTTVLATNNITDQPAGNFELQKYVCESEADSTEIVTGIEKPGIGCEPGVATFQIYSEIDQSLVGEFTTPETGYVLLQSIPTGDFRLVEVGSGESVIFTIADGETTSFTVYNYYKREPSGDLSLEKIYCEAETAGTDFILDPTGGLPAECYRGAADFEIYPFITGTPIPVSTDANGYLTVSDLPVGTHLLVEVQSGAETQFTIVDRETTSYRVVNRYIREPAGDLYLEKIYCIAEEPGTEFTSLDAIEVSPDCHRGPASFKIYPFKTGDPIAVSTDANGYLLVPGLPVGTHLLQEVGSGATTEFTIVDLEQTDIGVINSYVPGKTGMVEIRKYFEYGDHAQTHFYVGDPGVWPPLPKTDNHYWLGNADFEIWPFGDESAKIEFSTGHGGVIVLTVPVTTAQTGPHVILEVASGKTAEFEIAPDQTTIVKAVNTLVKEAETPGKTEPTAAEEVASVGGLPVTGVGEASTGHDPVTAVLGSLFALLALAMMRVWRASPYRR